MKYTVEEIKILDEMTQKIMDRIVDNYRKTQLPPIKINKDTNLQ